ncbi:WD40-repeat-containing domain protein [Trichoderma compactum]
MTFPDKPVAHLLGSNGAVHAVAYSASPGNYILTGSADRSIRLYNPFPSTSVPEIRPGAKPAVPQGRLIQTYAAHGYEVLSLAVASDNESFVSGGGDRAVFLWDVSRAVTTRRFGGNAQGHSARINCVSFAGAGDSLVVSGGFDTTVRLWDVRSTSFKPIQVLSEAKDSVTSLVVRGPEVIAGSVDGRVRSYDVRMGACTTDVVGASVVSLDLTKDGKAMLVGSLDSKLRLMDRDNGTCLRAYADPLWKNEDLRVQSLLGGREKYVVAGDEMVGEADASGSGRLWAWDLLSGKVVAKVTVPWGPQGHEAKKLIGKDGKPKVRNNVISCMAWRDGGWGDQFCVGGTSGVVTVFGAL